MAKPLAYRLGNKWVVKETVVSQGKYDKGPFYFGESYEDGSLKRVIDSLLSIREMIPKEYWDTARCGIESDGSWESCDYPFITINYLRAATESEIASSLAHEKDIKAMTENKERSLYRKLAAKYGQP